MTKVSHWFFREGRKCRWAQPPEGISQKTYEREFSCFPAEYGEVRLSQKNGCGISYDAAAYLFFRRK